MSTTQILASGVALLVLAFAFAGCEKEEPAHKGKDAPVGATRTLHPLNDDAKSCLEMYSACEPDPSGSGERCTSAPFHLECDEKAKLPSTGETLHCVCP